MQYRTVNLAGYLVLAAICAMAVLGTGCPIDDGGGSGKSAPQLTTIISVGNQSLSSALVSSLSLKAGENPVPIEEIGSLVVTITEISVHHAGDDSGDGKDNGEWIVLFPGDPADPPLRIDLMDIGDLGRVLTVDELPAGKYTKIVMEIEDPELTLAGEDEPVDEEIKTTANGRIGDAKARSCWRI